MATVNPIPPGFHTVTPHLIVKDAAKALDFYSRAFGAQELSRMPGPNGEIIHAQMRIGDSPIMLPGRRPQERP
jgi:PhnB protein